MTTVNWTAVPTNARLERPTGQRPAPVHTRLQPASQPLRRRGAALCHAAKQQRVANAAKAPTTSRVTSVAAQPAPPAATLLTPQHVSMAVMALTVYHVALFAVLLVTHDSQPVRSFMRSLWPFLPLALGYGLLLANSWSPDTWSIMMPGNLQEGLTGFKPQFFPQIESIAILFQRPFTAASWLIHVWAINLFLGRTIFVEGIEQGITTWHSLILACVLGPLGMLSHMITKAVWKPSGKPVVVADNGTITILPYE